MLLKPGTLVMLVGTDGYTPPMGAIGEVVLSNGPDDYDVLFHRHPCPVPPGKTWNCARSWLMILKSPGDPLPAAPTFAPRSTHT